MKLNPVTIPNANTAAMHSRRLIRVMPHKLGRARSKSKRAKLATSQPNRRQNRLQMAL